MPWALTKTSWEPDPYILVMLPMSALPVAVRPAEGHVADAVIGIALHSDRVPVGGESTEPVCERDLAAGAVSRRDGRAPRQ